MAVDMICSDAASTNEAYILFSGREKLRLQVNYCPRHGELPPKISARSDQPFLRYWLFSGKYMNGIAQFHPDIPVDRSGPISARAGGGALDNHRQLTWRVSPTNRSRDMAAVGNNGIAKVRGDRSEV